MSQHFMLALNADITKFLQQYEYKDKHLYIRHTRYEPNAMTFPTLPHALEFMVTNTPEGVYSILTRIHGELKIVTPNFNPYDFKKSAKPIPTYYHTPKPFSPMKTTIS